MSQAPMRRRSQRLNATLSILLLALAVVLVNDAARRHVSFKRDLSELTDRLGHAQDCL